MIEQEKKFSIQSAIRDFSENNLTEQSISLFKTLGYNTNRRNPFTNKTYQEFQDNFGDFFAEKKFNEAKALTKDWKYIDLLFQLTKNEVSDQENLFNTGKVKWEGEDKETVIETYLFFVVELINSDYSRSQLAQITREINKIFSMPAMLLFKYGDHLTLSIINRRLHKKDTQKDVLEKVTLIKDISIKNPHRAHLEILFDLSFDELKRNYKFTNFVELHNAWQDTLDIKELNKKFYRELSNWYFWAINNVSFPNDVSDDTDDTKYNSESVIRLITRLIFIWFIKEKKLIPEKIFDKKELPKLIKGFKEKGSKVYYRAILQNLFFATLNQKIEDRKFANDGGYLKHRVDYGIKNLYRYADDFLISKEEVIELFKKVPFLNGGLFDCLDRENHDNKVIYLDGFSRNPKKQAQVPDELFFSQENSIDLSDIYSDKRKKNEKVKGLFNIFSHYKFTVAENTPIEEEVALDPELLGRVFENLLASYNPETKTTARKQTGSFYTPREIVNYMVDESLKAYLKQKLETEAGMESEDAEYGLEVLLGYNEKDHLFNPKETNILVKAIDNCKIIDPACGSGAFPMGILHKLVFILQKLDPLNDIWRKVQLENAIKQTENTFKLGDKKEREERLIEINNTFDENVNNPDYARKLFLIENCIYGVDIQPIANQISKLRFFISLVVDQKTDTNRDNLDIRPLPNLELKFVSANTLIGIEKPQAQGVLLDNPKVKELEKMLQDVRHRLFSAKTSTAKQRLREKDKKLRDEMSSILKGSGWSNQSARQLAKWDPYDQNASSPFFDPEWMFGIKDGFDVVIGNPPYVDSENMTKNDLEFRNILKKHYKTAKGNWDLFVIFIEKGMRLTKIKGAISYIVPNKLISAKYTSELRAFINKKTVYNLIDYSMVDVFKEADVYPVVFLFINSKHSNNNIITKVMKNLSEPKSYNKIKSSVFYSDIFWDKYFFDKKTVELIVNISLNKRLINLFNNIKGAATVNEAYKIKEVILDLSNANFDKSNIDYFKFTNTGTIDPYKTLWGIKKTQYIKGSYKKPIVMISDLKRISSERFKQSLSPKIIIAGMSLRFEAFFDKGNYCAGKSTNLILGNSDELKALTGLLNSKIINFWLQKYFNSLKMAGGYFNISPYEIGLVPIPDYFNLKYSQISKIVEFINVQKKMNNNASFFELLIDAIIYELFFLDEVENAKAEVVEYLKNIPELKDEWDKDKKLEIIEEVHKELSNPNHPVSIAMEKQKTIPEIRIIEGLPEKT